MSLFGKKEDKMKKKGDDMPKLPELPRLPSISEPVRLREEPTESGAFNLPEPPTNSQLPQLPSFPSSDFGEKMSQNTIKDAVTGGEGDEEEIDIEEPIMPLTPPKPKVTNVITPGELRKVSSISAVKKRTATKEPVFIRLDKFEESITIFDQTKEKIDEMQAMLGEIKELKEKEQMELAQWEFEIQQMKSQIEVVDKNIFSKIE